MVNSSKFKNTSVYVVTGRRIINDRINKLSKLRPEFDSLKYIYPGKKYIDDYKIVIRPIPNPTKILKLISLNKLKSHLDKFLFFPSAQILFVWAIQKILDTYIYQDIQSGKNVTLLICFPPHALSVLGIRLKEKYPQIRLVVDWQDLWSYDENYFGIVPKIYHKRLYKLEKKILSVSDMNIVTNKNAKKVLEKEYRIQSNRVYAIEHHYDSEDNLELQKNLKDYKNSLINNPIRIGLLGTFFKPPRVPGEKFLETMQLLKSKGIDIELHLHGRVPDEIKKKINKSNLSEVIFIHGRVGHDEAVNELFKYDYLLLLLESLPNSNAVMSIKLPHYLMVGKPILAIVPNNSAVADIVRETGSGFVIDVSSDWNEKLATIIENGDESVKNLKRNKKNIVYYSWENISTRWLNVLG
jgi:hypothetical protein